LFTWCPCSAITLFKNDASADVRETSEGLPEIITIFDIITSLLF
jgi:hypothetical protein